MGPCTDATAAEPQRPSRAVPEWQCTNEQARQCGIAEPTCQVQCKQTRAGGPPAALLWVQPLELQLLWMRGFVPPCERSKACRERKLLQGKRSSVFIIVRHVVVKIGPVPVENQLPQFLAGKEGLLQAQHKAVLSSQWEQLSLASYS